jgi:hypothetical protein
VLKSNASKLVVLALVVMVVALALVMPVVAGAVARADDGSTAAVCQSEAACGGRQVAVWPLPGTNAVCQSDFACGG